MKKLMVAALAVASCTAFADEVDIKAKAEGFYDVQMTTKRLVHVEKKISKSFKLPSKEPEYIKAYQDALDERIPETEVIAVTNTARTSVKLSYTRYDYKLNGEEKVYKSKIVSETYKGLYDATSEGGGKVYMWSAAAADKIKKQKDDSDGYDIIVPGTHDKSDKVYSGYVAYEVPLAMHGQFKKTHDDKVAGGFLGGAEFAQDGKYLDFTGLTAFGTGTKNKDDKDNGAIKSVAGNVAAKYDTDDNGMFVGAYGTWKISRVTTKNFPTEIKAALAKRGCVELVLEGDHD